MKFSEGTAVLAMAWGLGALLGALLVAAPVQAAEPAQAPGAVQSIRVLQSIPSGTWSMTSRSEPGGAEEAPQTGCLSAEMIARDLQELVEVVQAGQQCSVQLTRNTEELGVLELRCTQNGREFLPAVMEFRRPAPDRFESRSQLQMGARSMQLEQDYHWQGACLQTP